MTFDHYTTCPLCGEGELELACSVAPGYPATRYTPADPPEVTWDIKSQTCECNLRYPTDGLEAACREWEDKIGRPLDERVLEAGSDEEDPPDGEDW